MQLAEIMSTDVLAVPPDVPVADAARRMVERETGVAVVREGDELVGIISERDMLRLLSEGGDASIPVRDRMTRNVLVGSPSMAIPEALAIMIQGRFRHLPVTDGG